MPEISNGAGLASGSTSGVERYFARLEELYREYEKKVAEELAVDAAIDQFRNEVENADRIAERSREIAIERLRRKHDPSRVQAAEETGSTGLDPRPQDDRTDWYA